jgi:hypothetical protein
MSVQSTHQAQDHAGHSRAQGRDKKLSGSAAQHR